MTLRMGAADVARGLGDCLETGALPSIDAYLAETGPDGQLENEAWVCSLRLRGLRVFQKKFTRPYVCWREHKRVSVPASAVLALLRDYSPARLRWDPSLLESSVVETLPGGAQVVRFLYSSPSVHRSREFLVVVNEVRRDRTVYILMQSVKEHKDVPTSARFVRATMIISGFSVAEDPADANSCIYTHLSQVDIKQLQLNSFDIQQEESLTSFRPRVFGLERLIAEQKGGVPNPTASPSRMSEERKQSAMILARKVTKIRRMVDKEPPAAPVEAEAQPSATAKAAEPAPKAADPTPEPAEDSFVPFEMIMQDPVCRVYFGRFLDTEFNGENLEFWTAVEDYKAAVATNNADEIRVQATSILKRYVKSGAELQVNISQTLRAEIEAAVKAFTEKPDKPPPVDMFKRAQDAIYDLMHRDPYRRFIESDVYADMLEYLDDNGSNLFDRILEEFFGEIDSSADIISAGLGGSGFQRTSSVGAGVPLHRSSSVPVPVDVGALQGAEPQKRISDTSVGSSSSGSTCAPPLQQTPPSQAAPARPATPGSGSGTSNRNSHRGTLWVPTFAGDGAIVSKKRGTGSLVCVREMKRMDVSAERVVAAALDTNAAALARWLGKVVEARVVETVLKDTCVLHITKKASFPLHRNRDFSVIRLSRQDLDGVHYVLLRSISHKGLPPGDKCVRGRIAASGFMIQPDKQTPQRCFVTFLSQIDMRLASFETKIHRREASKISVLNGLQKFILSQ